MGKSKSKKPASKSQSSTRSPSPVPGAGGVGDHEGGADTPAGATANGGPAAAVSDDQLDSTSAEVEGEDPAASTTTTTVAAPPTSSSEIASPSSTSEPPPPSAVEEAAAAAPANITTATSSPPETTTTAQDSVSSTLASLPTLPLAPSPAPPPPPADAPSFSSSVPSSSTFNASSTGSTPSVPLTAAGVLSPTDSPRPSLELPSRASLDASFTSAASSSSGAYLLDPRVQEQLDRVTREKELLEKQYRALVAKVGTMRDTLGKKLREDAEELDRREAQITALTTETSTLQTTLATVQTELVAQSTEASELASELSQLRLQASSSSDSSLARERDFREELERVRSEREDWELACEKERERADEEERRARVLEAEQRRLRDEGMREREAAKRERERASNLQGVLEEFQGAKDVEIEAAVNELQTHLRNSLTSLGEWKLRAVTAENRVEDLQNNAGRSQALEKEVKEKNLLIGKLRHETVIMNEHLTEALRRLRRNSSDTNVDRRLVTNILLSFLTTPRADPKRFEMLSLLSSILLWTDLEREQAGLQRASGSSGGGGMVRRVSGVTTKATLAPEEPPSESFSQLFVEFLLKEASSGSTPNTANSSTPSTPTAGSSFFSPGPPTGSSRMSLTSPSSPHRPRTLSFTSSSGGGGAGAEGGSVPASPNPGHRGLRRMGSSQGLGLMQVLGRNGEDGGGSPGEMGAAVRTV